MKIGVVRKTGSGSSSKYGFLNKRLAGESENLGPEGDQKSPKTEKKAKKRNILLALMIVGFVLGFAAGVGLHYFFYASLSRTLIAGLVLASAFSGAGVFGISTWIGLKIVDLFKTSDPSNTTEDPLKEKLLAQPLPSSTCQKPVEDLSHAPVPITTMTWNMGNQAASPKVVEELMGQLLMKNGEKPIVIGISTQEELASEGERLQDLLLSNLNEGISLDEQYALVQTDEPQFHTTMAGANNSGWTFFKAAFTSSNRVSSAVLVKNPFSLENAIAEIDYEPGKESGYKSVITIKGTLTSLDDGMSLNLSISGGHLDSDSDGKRREHANKFLDSQGMASVKTFDKIHKEASSLKILMGDFNERDCLMQNGQTQDRFQWTNYRAYGFDVRTTPDLKMGETSIHGTYGFEFDSQGEQVITNPDPRGRANVARGGYLDRVIYSSALKVKSDHYGIELDREQFDKENGLYHGSDHIPVIRRFEVTPESESRAEIVGEYIKRRLPDFTQEVEQLKGLLEGKSLSALENNVKSMQYHDSNISPVDYLKQLAGVEQGGYKSIKKGLKTRYNQKQEIVSKKIEKITESIDKAVKKNATEYLAHVFNQITRCNQWKNAALENRGEDNINFSELIERAVEQWIDSSYRDALEFLKKGVNKTPQEGNINRALPAVLTSFSQAPSSETKGIVPIASHRQPTPSSR